MTLKRALSAAPLAVAVALLAHLAVFGFGHAPGAEHAAGLLAALAAALGLSFGATFLAGALGFVSPIATSRRIGYAGPLGLAALSAVTFGLIECSEGHGHLASAPWPAAVLAILPIAIAVAWLAGCAGRAVYGAGNALAEYVPQPRRRRPSFFFLQRAQVPVRAASYAPGARRGRAPPLPH
jgi:hypothetical protein